MVYCYHLKKFTLIFPLQFDLVLTVCVSNKYIYVTTKNKNLSPETNFSPNFSRIFPELISLNKNNSNYLSSIIFLPKNERFGNTKMFGRGKSSILSTKVQSMRKKLVCEKTVWSRWIRSILYITLIAYVNQ